MNNEIKRKLTSLTLMTIMVAGGMTFAIPGVMPDAYAVATKSNPHLFVSGEGHNSENEIGPGNVIEVVIIDPLLSDTDEGLGEPSVSVNGQDLRMAQATDGAWYAYFMDRDGAKKADANLGNDITDLATVDASAQALGLGLNYGVFCSSDNATSHLGINIVAPAYAVARIPDNNIYNGSVGTADPDTCGGQPFVGDGNNILNDHIADDGKIMNVIRENETLNDNNGNLPLGQIGIHHSSVSYWPFIQLFDFAEDGDIEIIYDRAGGDESVTLLFDDPAETLELDRTKYPQGAEILITIEDQALNVDPTDEDVWTWGTDIDNQTAYYQLYDEDGNKRADGTIAAKDVSDVAIDSHGEGHFDENLKVNPNAQDGEDLIIADSNDDVILNVTDANGNLGTESVTGESLPVSTVESGSNSAVFQNWAESNDANLQVRDNAPRGVSFAVEYEDPNFISGIVGHFYGTIDLDETSVGDEWTSGEKIDLTLDDKDANLNPLTDEDLDLDNPSVPRIPAIKIGEPIVIPTVSQTTEGTTQHTIMLYNETIGTDVDAVTLVETEIDQFSHRALTQITNCLFSDASDDDTPDFSHDVPCKNLNEARIDVTFIGTPANKVVSDFLKNGTDTVYHYLNYDIGSWEAAINSGIGPENGFKISFGDFENTAVVTVEEEVAGRGFIHLSDSVVDDIAEQLATEDNTFVITFEIDNGGNGFDFDNSTKMSTAVDIFRFGQDGDGDESEDRFNDAIYRAELEETGDSTGIFTGTVEFVMLNQLNQNQLKTYDGLRTIDSDLRIIVNEDFTDEDSVRINYLDLGADGVETQVSDQQEAPTHSGVVSFGSSTYKVADTVVITLEDLDLNVDSDVVDIYTVVSDISDAADNTVGVKGYGFKSDGETPFGRLLDITFDDNLWTDDPDGNDISNCEINIDNFDFASTGFTLIETSKDSGVFTGDFQVPSVYCATDTKTESVTGVDMEVNYVDHRDASGEIIEVGDSAGIRANTGSISLDRTVYPVPWGVVENFAEDLDSTGPAGRSIFPTHGSSINAEASTTDGIDATETLGNGDLTIHVRINDPDFDVSASGEDVIAQDVDGEEVGPVKIVVQRGSDEVVLAYAGGATPHDGYIDAIGEDGSEEETRQLGAIPEIAPDAGIFELDFDIRYTDGPASKTCPATENFTPTNGSDSSTHELSRFNVESDKARDGNYCILQGDILFVEYTDPTDASGSSNTVTDSATFDLRNGVLQSDKSVYIIGSDMILTIIEPDWDLDNDAGETYDLDVIEWNSDAADLSMGNAGGSSAAFDPEPSALRETGDSTGIFQVVVEIPAVLDNDPLERGEEIELEYTDWGPSGADFVGQEDEDVGLTVFTSNFGATIELDQKVYTWTDKIYITIVAPDHNFDSDLIDEIGDSGDDPIKIATRGSDIDNYRLVETGTDTGIFTGEVILTGFDTHDADGDGKTGDAPGITSDDDAGPTDGFLEADDDDGITVSFEFSADETVVGSALVRWNIGEVQWLEASYPASGTGVVRIVDPDMNLDPEAVDNFHVDVWSDSDAGGIDLAVTETNEATGIFEGTVFFTVEGDSSGHRLRVAEGDTITAEYEDNTLPDPYTTADELDITGTSLIGTIVPPLERAPVSNARVVDAFGNSLSSVSVDQQVQVTADLVNGQDREQSFAYLVQVQDGNGVTVSLAWITGSLSAGQSFSPALSWIPDASGSYTATVFVWESVDNPTALSPPASVPISVS